MAFLTNAWHRAGWANELEDDGLLACGRNIDSSENDTGIQNDAEDIFQFEDGAMVSDFAESLGMAERITPGQAEWKESIA